jgi:secreted PhoX family phosphatase
MHPTRRHFLRSAAAFAVGIGGLASFTQRAQASKIQGYGALRRDPQGVLDLPPGFSYRIISKSGETMSDGFKVPVATDGMAAFPGSRGKTILVRNHEVNPDVSRTSGAFGDGNALLGRVDAGSLYDPGAKRGFPTLGGCTTMVYDHASGRIEREFLSLAGTLRNCAGGPTPWGS